ncbi:MAG TPA: helicase HerA-like domain-containing protein [Flavobacterium sp.]|nr:helicase HerA-like domain-containing protein [Flavobacterium sp.]
MSRALFIKEMEANYHFKNRFITLGGIQFEKELIPNLHLNIPLKTLNRHGLIAGATGTGKTKTIQVLCEQLSQQGIPVFMMDIKGDFSGIAKPGTLNDFIENRHTQMNIPFEPKGFPVEFYTLSHQNGVRLRATISEFGPVLLSRILDLNDTQSGVIALIFKYCDDKQYPLLDLKDLKKVLHFITNEGKESIEKEYGRISTASTGAILRKLIELEQQDADLFFGETSFEVSDLMRINDKGQGQINILRLNDIQDKPKLFSTFMLCLLAEIYNTLPEQGDSGQPELVLFIDEAHLIFKEATKALQNQIETIVKLIRSKGVGIYFITQNPTDIPEGVLSQLGLKIQHALRAFTAKDRKAIKSASENFPSTPYYVTNEIITQLGTGEALVTVLNEKGAPTALAVTAIRAPESRMDILMEEELNELINQSKLKKKYNTVIDRESAYEILNRKISHLEEIKEEQNKTSKQSSSRSNKKEESLLTKQLVKVVTSATFIRGAFGVLKKLINKK